MSSYDQRGQSVYTQFNSETINISVENMSVEEISQTVVKYLANEKNKPHGISQSNFKNSNISYETLRTIVVDLQTARINFYLYLERSKPEIEELTNSALPIELIVLLTLIKMLERTKQKIKIEILEFDAVSALEQYNENCHPEHKLQPSEFNFPDENSDFLFQALTKKLKGVTETEKEIEKTLEKFMGAITQPIRALRK